jgi:hypothetical protein
VDGDFEGREYGMFRLDSSVGVYFEFYFVDYVHFFMSFFPFVVHLLVIHGFKGILYKDEVSIFEPLEFLEDFRKVKIIKKMKKSKKWF